MICNAFINSFRISPQNTLMAAIQAHPRSLHPPEVQLSANLQLRRRKIKRRRKREMKWRIEGERGRFRMSRKKHLSWWRKIWDVRKFLNSTFLSIVARWWILMRRIGSLWKIVCDIIKKYRSRRRKNLSERLLSFLSDVCFSLGVVFSTWETGLVKRD